MAEKIDTLSSRYGDEIFVTLGAAHLAGTSGVVALLRSMGYVVKPLPM